MATIIGNIIDITGSPDKRVIGFELIDGPGLAGGSLVGSGKISQKSDVNGDFSQVLAEGNYKVTLDGTDLFYISVPSGAASYDITERITSALPAAVSVGGEVLNSRLKEMTNSGAFEMLAISYDAQGVITTATVQWSDGSAGVFTTLTKSGDGDMIDSFQVTHVDSAKTVTQPGVTRNGDGDITTKPALTVS